MKRYVVAITGASGIKFGLALIRELSKSSEVHLILSSNAIPIIKHETGIDFSADISETARGQFNCRHILAYRDSDLFAPVSSGSFITEGMYIVPCSVKTLSAVANGYAGNLIERAADVTIKEARPLVISPREMPFSAIHLENMLRLARLGVTIAPPVPGFYTIPETLEDIVDFVTGKLLDQMKVSHNLFKRWSGE